MHRTTQIDRVIFTEVKRLYRRQTSTKRVMCWRGTAISMVQPIRLRRPVAVHIDEIKKDEHRYPPHC